MGEVDAEQTALTWVSLNMTVKIIGSHIPCSCNWIEQVHISFDRVHVFKSEKIHVNDINI